MKYASETACFAGAVLALCLAAGCGFRNSPPATPAAPTGPTLLRLDSTSHVAALYISSAIDPDGDSVYLGTGSDDAVYPSENWSRLVGSGDTVNTRFEWYNSGTYRLRVRALDEHGYYSGWSGWLTVTVQPVTARMTDEFKPGPDPKKESQ